MREVIDQQARDEMAAEAFRAAVDAEKERLRTYRPWWLRLFPWRVKITVYRADERKA